VSCPFAEDKTDLNAVRRIDSTVCSVGDVTGVRIGGDRMPVDGFTTRRWLAGHF
jgi:hypothetical protein